MSIFWYLSLFLVPSFCLPIFLLLIFLCVFFDVCVCVSACLMQKKHKNTTKTKYKNNIFCVWLLGLKLNKISEKLQCERKTVLMSGLMSGLKARILTGTYVNTCVSQMIAWFYWIISIFYCCCFFGCVVYQCNTNT